MVLASLAAVVVRAGHHRDGGGSAARSRRDAPALLRAALAGFVLATVGITSAVASGATSVAAAATPPAGQDPPFSINGSVTGLAPGVGSQLPLTISNPFNFPIRVVTLTVAVGDAGASCLGKNLQVQPLQRSVPVPARGSATTLLPVTILSSSPDVCQQAAWPLTYGGQAVRVSSSAGGGGTGIGPSGNGGTGTGPSGSATGDTPIGSPAQTSNGPTSTGLAFTGFALWILVAAAAALILAGAALLVAQRRRSRLAAERVVADESWAQ
jgi:hypothetical protein